MIITEFIERHKKNAYTSGIKTGTRTSMDGAGREVPPISISLILLFVIGGVNNSPWINMLVLPHNYTHGMI